MVVYTLYDTDARVRREAETLAATGEYEITVYALKDQPTPRRYVLDGVQVEQLDAAKYRGSNAVKYILSYVTFTAKALWSLSRLALSTKVDFVHIHNMPNFLIFSALVPLVQRRTIVLDVHDTMPETFASSFSGWKKRVFVPLLMLEERICCALADHVICVNEVQRQALVRRLPGVAQKTAISMNVPDPTRFARVRSSPTDTATGRLKLVYHGTLSGRLTVDSAIRAMAAVSSQAPDLELHIIGDGDAREYLEQVARDLGLVDRVVFDGRMKLDELVPIIRKMDVGVVPLEQNPATELMLSVKLMECLSQGLAVIAPRLKGIQYYFSEEMLFYFDPGDVASLAQAMLAARDPNSRRARLEKADAFLTTYHWDRHKSSLLKIYGYEPTPSTGRTRLSTAS
jgi:glycosyltransferase involved in cell wall biosynthesis